MSYDYAVVKEQGVTFVVVCVSESTIRSTFEAQRARAGFESEYRLPVLLWGNRNENVYGRPDLVRYMKNVHVSQIPWRRKAG